MTMKALMIIVVMNLLDQMAPALMKTLTIIFLVVIIVTLFIP